MHVIWLDEETAISGAMGPEGVPGAVEAGFQTIINNRPDGEQDHQPKSDSIEFAAKNKGLHYRHVPLAIRTLSSGHIEDMQAALNETPAPRVAFCRSGARSYLLWALAKAEDEADLEKLIEQAAGHGFDISAARLLTR
ncbi:MAG: TIGR01244 family sulfur transferase [Pseudomonadota bacterium]